MGATLNLDVCGINRFLSSFLDESETFGVDSIDSVYIFQLILYFCTGSLSYGELEKSCFLLDE